MESPNYRIRELSNDFGYGSTTWKEAFINGRWVMHGLSVDKMYHLDGENNMYVDITEYHYEKGAIVRGSVWTQQCVDSQ